MNSRYERSTDVLYRLTAIYYENKRYARYPRFKVWKHTYGYFHTLEGAEELMRKQVDKRKSFAEDDIGFHYYGFMIDEIPFGQKLGSIYDSYCTRTYLEDGTFFASTKVSNIQSADVSYYYCRGFEPFKGRSEDECNFTAGDLVEVFDGDTVSLQIVYSPPPTPERAEQIYQNVRNDLSRRGKEITDDELGWMLDYSDDSYVTLDGDEGYMENHLHWYATELFPVRRRVSDKLREKLERGFAKVQNELKS